jgi:TatD DNase family protein
MTAVSTLVSSLTDTHAHVCDASFAQDLASVLERAKRSGVGSILAVGEDIGDARRNLELSEKHPMILPAAGLYPIHLDLDAATHMEMFIRENRSRLVAIGEVGLDYWVVKEEDKRALQRDIFSRFIRLSLELKLPLNVHSRSAGRYALKALLDGGAKQAQMHAFDGKVSYALPAVEAGYFFSIPTSVGRSSQKQKLAKALPLECLLLETDSPVLGPDPKIRNEPANLILAARAIAEIKELSLDAVLERVKENTRRLYGHRTGNRDHIGYR